MVSEAFLKIAGDFFPYSGASFERFNISKSTAPKLQTKCHLTKDISENTRKTLDFLSNIVETK